MVDRSQVVAQGKVVESWTAWDRNHRYIWTHYRIRISDEVKGSGAGEVVVSEPGGTLEGQTLRIADAVAYSPGEEVIVFARRTPAGYLRTTGYGQGKYSIRNGRVRNNAARLSLAEPSQKARAARAQAPEAANGVDVESFKAQLRSLVTKKPAGR